MYNLDKRSEDWKGRQDFGTRQVSRADNMTSHRSQSGLRRGLEDQNLQDGCFINLALKGAAVPGSWARTLQKTAFRLLKHFLLIHFTGVRRNVHWDLILCRQYFVDAQPTNFVMASILCLSGSQVLLCFLIFTAVIVSEGRDFSSYFLIDQLCTLCNCACAVWHRCFSRGVVGGAKCDLQDITCHTEY